MRCRLLPMLFFIWIVPRWVIDGRLLLHCIFPKRINLVLIDKNVTRLPLKILTMNDVIHIVHRRSYRRDQYVG